MKYNIILIEKQTVYVDDLKIVLEIGKFFDNNKKRDCYYVKSNYKNIYAVSDNVTKAINECIERIKRKKILKDNNVKLLSEKEGVDIAKNYFEKHYNIEDKQNLWFEWQVDVNLLKLHVLL